MNTIGKSERMKLYRRYGSRCIYCGKEITYEEMRLDWFIPGKDGGNCSLFNLKPACISCSKFKHGKNIEEFRSFLDNLPKKIAKKNSNYRIAVHFGLIKENESSTVFYFEKNHEKNSASIKK